MNPKTEIVPIHMPPVADIVARQLRAWILDGSLKALEHINEAQLAAKFQVSRGPVREAVQRLVQEGLLKSTRNRGAFVVDLGPADVEDVYTARAAIERQSARLVLRGPTTELTATLEQILSDMATALKEGNWSDMALADLRFHQAVVTAAESHRLSKMFSTLAAETLICIRKFRTVYHEKEVILEQHQKLLDLIKAGNLDGYLREISAHMYDSVTMLHAAAQRSHPQPPPVD